MRNQITPFVLPILLAIALLGSGCGNKNNQQSGTVKLSKDEEARKEASKTAFETMKDPEITAQTRVAAAQFAEASGNVPNAIFQYREAVKINPKDVQSTYRLSVLLTASRQYEEAIHSWKSYAKLTNGSATAYSNLGFCYELSKKLDLAEKAYKEGVEREPGNRLCRINYGLMLARLGRIPEATGQLEVVLTPAEVQYNLASVFEQVGLKPEAREAYRRALEIDPNFEDAQQRLAGLN